jgi:hypothetical protein
MSEKSMTIDTPAGIEYYRLAVIKSRIKLESKGLKFRGNSTRSLVAAELGLTPRTKPEKFIEVIELKMQKILENNGAA